MATHRRPGEVTGRVTAYVRRDAHAGRVKDPCDDPRAGTGQGSEGVPIPGASGLTAADVQFSARPVDGKPEITPISPPPFLCYLYLFT